MPCPPMVGKLLKEAQSLGGPRTVRILVNQLFNIFVEPNAELPDSIFGSPVRSATGSFAEQISCLIVPGSQTGLCDTSKIKHVARNVFMDCPTSFGVNVDEGILSQESRRWY